MMALEWVTRGHELREGLGEILLFEIFSPKLLQLADQIAFWL
jgi:hypothetical protein